MQNIFDSESIDKVLYDYNQFDTKIITSMRGRGKTFKVQKYLLNKYFNKGNFFAVLRESQIEVDNMLFSGFWDNNLISKPEYCKHKYEVVGNKIVIDNLVVGVCIALTTYGNFRGVALNLGTPPKGAKCEKIKKDFEEAESFVENNIDNLTTVFFDEFEPIEPKMSNEKRYKAYLHICETLFRFRENICAILCANLESAYSIFLSEFNFTVGKHIEYGIKKSYIRDYSKPLNKKAFVPLAVWVHLDASEDWKNARKNSYVGKLQMNKNDNMFTNGMDYKNNNFIKIPKGEKHYLVFNITDGENFLSVWKVKNSDFCHITERSNNTTYSTFCFKIENAIFGIKLISNDNKKSLTEMFSKDLIKFDNAKTFSIFVNMIK